MADDSKQICAANPSTYKSLCNGNEGEPLLTQYQRQYAISGVFSDIEDCMSEDGPSSFPVYARVSVYKSMTKYDMYI